MKIAVIIPSRNEERNIDLLLDKLFGMIKTVKKHKFQVIIVDSSEDGTSEKIKKAIQEHKNLYLINEKEHGLGKAYSAGFKEALRKGVDLIIQMDADLSHPPSLIPRLIHSIEKGNDVVIASRYIKGGSTPDWSLDRKLISRLGNLFFRNLSGLQEVSDCTSGFRAIKTSSLKKVDDSALSSRGYFFQAMLILNLSKTGSKIAEVPLVFLDRKYGSTKLGRRDILDFTAGTSLLGFKTYRTFILFIIMGVICSVFSLVLLYILVQSFGLDKKLAAPLISVELSIILSYILNDKFTFRDSKKEPHHIKFGRFHIAALSGFILNLLLYNLILHYFNLSRFVGSLDYLFAQVLAISFITFWNFYINSRWTWKIIS